MSNANPMAAIAQISHCGGGQTRDVTVQVADRRLQIAASGFRIQGFATPGMHGLTVRAGAYRVARREVAGERRRPRGGPPRQPRHHDHQQRRDDRHRHDRQHAEHQRALSGARDDLGAERRPDGHRCTGRRRRNRLLDRRPPPATASGRPDRARERAPLRAAPPEQRRDEQRRQRRVAGKRVLRRDVEDRLRHAQRDQIGDDRDEHDEDAARLHLHRLAEARLAAVEREHVLGEHRRQRENLRVARHHRRHHARRRAAPPATAARTPRPAAESHRRPTRRRAEPARARPAPSVGPAAASGAPRLELGFDGRHVRARRSPPRRETPTAARWRACRSDTG